MPLQIAVGHISGCRNIKRMDGKPAFPPNLPPTSPNKKKIEAHKNVPKNSFKKYRQSQQ